MGKHIIHVESTGTHTHPKYGGSIAERAERYPDGAERHGRELVRHLRESGHIVHSATVTHWPGEEEERTESLLDDEPQTVGAVSE